VYVEIPKGIKPPGKTLNSSCIYMASSKARAIFWASQI